MSSYSVAALLLLPIALFAQTADTRCGDPAGLNLQWKLDDTNCVQINGGFSGTAGSYGEVSYATTNNLHLGETLRLDAELGMRQRRGEVGFSKATWFGLPVEGGFTAYTGQFTYNQSRESSFFAFDRDIPLYDHLDPQNVLNYARNSYGATAFAQRRFHSGRAALRLTYSYDVSEIKSWTISTTEMLHELGSWTPDQWNKSTEFSGIRTSKLTPSFVYNTVDHPNRSTRGTFVSASFGIAGLGGDVKTIEPAVEARHFRRGFRERDVVGLRFSGRFITGYDDRTVPVFDRYFLGGEDEIRGFDSWSVSPVLYMPEVNSVNVVNADGTPRMQRIPVGNTWTTVNVTMSIPTTRPVMPGGDTKLIANLEYRIPVAGPVTLVLFDDAGMNRISRPAQLLFPEDRLLILNAQYPLAGFQAELRQQSGLQKVRMSTGAEVRVDVPFLHAPVRFYWAYNPLAFRNELDVPLPADRGMFPNRMTYESALSTFGMPVVFRERRSLFRFAIGKTF